MFCYIELSCKAGLTDLLHCFSTMGALLWSKRKDGLVGNWNNMSELEVEQHVNLWTVVSLR